MNFVVTVFGKVGEACRRVDQIDSAGVSTVFSRGLRSLIASNGHCMQV